MQKTNILVISASPRSGSNSALAANYLISKVNQIVEMVAINNLDRKSTRLNSSH